jgi:hypothetical protein
MPRSHRRPGPKPAGAAPGLDQIVRFLAPSLAAIFVGLKTLDLLPELPNPSYDKTARWFGLLLPALWLTSIGPEGLLKGGGFFMRALGIQKPTHLQVTLFGLLWLLIYLSCGFSLYKKWLADSFWQYPVAGLGYAAAMSALGVFAFLAVAKKPQAR